MTRLLPELLDQIHKVAQTLPPPILVSITELVANQAVPSPSQLQQDDLLRRLPKASWRKTLLDLLTLWTTKAPTVSGEAISAALSMAAFSDEANQRTRSLELVWTGPNPDEIPLRRTDQALLQLICEAQQELTIISFAVYKVPEIAKELLSALHRGVSLRIIAETPESSDSKMPFGIQSAFGQEILEQAQVIVWPFEQRPKGPGGQTGSLHVKCAVSDREMVFISSANLTEYALTVNMEMGVLLQDQKLATQINRQIQALISQRILRPINEC